MTVVGRKLEVLSGVEEPAIVLSYPLALGAKLDFVALLPELAEVCRSAGAALVIELLEDAIGDDGGEIAPVSRDCDRIVDCGTLKVRLQSVKPTQQEQRTRNLQQSESAIGPVLQIVIEGRECRITIPHFPFDPAPC